MIIIGLTGSIGAGKSAAANYLNQKGIPVFDADAEVHKLYASKQGADMIRPYVPEATTDNKVDRVILARAVSKSPELLTTFEKTIHHAIKNRRQDFIAKANAEHQKAIILDTPLLFETASEKEVDLTLVISAKPESQKMRVLQRSGMTQDRLNMILSRQMPDAEKRKRADFVIENNGTLEELHKKLDEALKQWNLGDA